MEFLTEYGLFLAKAVTIVLAIVFVIIAAVAASGRGRGKDAPGHIELQSLNDKYDDMEDAIKRFVLEDDELKKEHKAQKKADKEAKKARKQQSEPERRKRVYVLHFDGDIHASAVTCLREEVSAVLTMADAQDEVVLCLESPGGLVHSYGLAASQLKRIVNRGIPLTVAVDAVAASGGYMMACIGNKILAAPFAVIGSIGVLAQIPNFHRLLKKNDVDVELLTAGEYKRTLTMFGENTDKGREKFVQELEETHELFKRFVADNRPQVDINQVATGEVWYGQRALECQLIDDVQTSDEYLMSLRESCDIFAISYERKKTLQEKLGFAAEQGVERLWTRLWSKLQYARHI